MASLVVDSLNRHAAPFVVRVVLACAGASVVVATLGEWEAGLRAEWE
jgi:hypothetical protein